MDPQRQIRIVLVTAVSVLLGSGFSAPSSASSDSQISTVTVDGLTVPDIGPLPTVVLIPSTNLNYRAKVELGKQLYFDGRLSKNNQIPCASCHLPATGFADVRQVSIGVGGAVGDRQAPTILNTAYNPSQFWDGRAGSLEEQVLGPIQEPDEMAETIENVVKKIGRSKGYQQQFRAVFGTEVNMQGIAEAIAAFERTIVSTNSAFDRYVLGDPKAMDESAIRGMALFKGKARCILCHNGPNFTDNQFHSLGVPQVGPRKEDLGRYDVTRMEHDKEAFKTPTLRSITETAPYMHDGAFKTLEEVVDFLDQGGGRSWDAVNPHAGHTFMPDYYERIGRPNPNLSPLIKPLGLSNDEKADMIAFLKALTGEPIKVEMPTLPK
jgi:cytochrome c peroxidase